MTFYDLIEDIISTDNRMRFYMAIEAAIMITKDEKVERCSRTTFQCARCMLHRNGGCIKDVYGADWIRTKV